ncbi:MAG: 50S ribosomal protein L10 [Actinobacteria bacterium]|nr:50S ribosomal protein L10 [Actinomycetota bacterium]
MPKKENINAVANIKKIFETNGSLIFTDHSGLKAQDAVHVRDKLIEADSYLKIIKNTLALIAAREVFSDIDLEEVLTGPTSVIVAGKDIVSTAKIVKEFSKNLNALKIKAGILENKLIDAESVEKIASLPSREVLLVQLVTIIQAPISGLVNTLSGLSRNLVMVLDAVRVKKENMTN